MTKHVVFDIGGVLVDWQPHLAWSDELGEAAARAFLIRVDFGARNLRCDRGETFAAVAGELSDPEDHRLLASYVDRYAHTVQTKVPGTWDVVAALQAAEVPLHAITNWSAETWPVGISVHPELGQIFGVTVVSGEERVTKPDPHIFQTLCDRAGIAPQDCVFIDDGAHNVAGAQAVGMDGIHFTGAAALHAALVDRGLL